jgi:hypothetical protein
LGIAALEDKVVQQAVVTILDEIYEVDFRGFSYGFRPGRTDGINFSSGSPDARSCTGWAITRARRLGGDVSRAEKQ